MKIVLYEQALTYAQKIWRYKWLSVSVAWAICVVGWPIMALIPPKYEATARVYVNADQLLTPLLRGVALDVNPLRQLEFLQRTLLSRPNLEQVVHLSDLDMLSQTKLGDKERDELLRRLALEVVITPQTANLMRITYRNPDPVVAKNVVQALLTVFAENSTGGNRKEMENAKRFLDQQIQNYETQLRAAEQRRAEFHQKYLDLLPGLDGAISRLDAGRNAVTKLQLEIEDLRARRDSLQHELESVPKVLSVDAAGPQVVVSSGKPLGARARLEEARTKLEDLQMRFTELHPDVVALHRQITMLEAEVAREKNRPASSSDSEGGGRKSEIANPLYDQIKVRLVEAETALASGNRRLDQAQHEQTALEEKAQATPGVQAQAQDLDRDYATKKRSYEELLQRREQARIGDAADTSADKIQFRVVDPPMAPVVPAAPNQPMLLSGVLVVAIAAALGLPFALLQFDRSYDTVSGLRALGLPVLGSVSQAFSRDRKRRERLEAAAVCTGLTVLVAAYGVLMMVSANLYRLSLT